jgi:hypothetical protein
LTFEPRSTWRLTHTGRLIRVDHCAKSGRVLAHYINDDGSKAKPEFRHVVSFSIDFLENFAKRHRLEELTSEIDRRNMRPADDAASAL